MKPFVRVKALVVCALVSVSGACSGEPAAGAVDLGPRRQLVYVTAARLVQKHGEAHSRAVDTVHVFDRATFERVGSFTLAGGAGDIGATGDGATVYVVNGNGNSVTLFDTQSYDLVSLDVGAGPEHSYLTPDHAQLWIANDASANVTVVDLASRTLRGAVLTGFGHHKIAFAENDEGGVAFGYVSNIGDSSITPVSADLVAQTNVAGVGPSPHGIDYSRSAHRVFNCSGDQNDSIEVIATRDDPATPEVNEQHALIARVPLPSRCRSLHTDEEGTFAFASLTDSDELVRLDARTLTLTLFETGASPDGFAVVGARAYVGNTGEATVSVIDMAGSESPGTISVGNAVDPSNASASGGRLIRRDGDHLFVTNAFDGTVSVIDTTSNTVVATLEGLPDVIGVTVAGPGGGTAFPR